MKKLAIQQKILFFSKFATWQFLLQAINLLNGFFLLRWLTIQEQAKFSVAFGIQSLILSLSDLGFTGSIIALVGDRFNDKVVVGNYIQTAKRLRNFLFAFSCLITLIVLPFIIKEQSWGYVEMSIIIIPVLLAVFWQVDCSLYDSTLVMHQKINKLYKPQVALASLKLSSNFLLHFSGLIGAFSTLALNALTLLINGKAFKKAAQPYVVIPVKNNDIVFKEMINYLKPLMPNLVFNALYGQVQIFLVSFFGHTNNIAEVGALGRLTQIFVFLSSINGIIIVPLIAKSSASSFKMKYFKILIISILVIVAIISSVILLPQFYLFLLGSKYNHLKSELILVISNACLTYLGGVLWSMHSARKWLFWWGTIAYISTILISQTFGIIFFDVSTTHGILCISLLTQAGLLLVHSFYGVLGFYRLKSRTS